MSDTGYSILKRYIDLHENRNLQELDRFINSYVPAWKEFHVNTTPWCAAAVNASERAAGKPGNGKLNARSFLTYGQCIYDRLKNIGDWKNAREGDIAIFERGGSTWQGHVAYFDGVDKDKTKNILIRTLGGNQSDSVSIGWYPLSRLIGVRRS